MANRPRKHHTKTFNITETMKKLISMTDYVLEQLKNATTETEKYAIVEWQNKCDAFDKIVNYANFIKKSLTLGDFIPCDENGNVLEEPNELDYTNRDGFFDKDSFKTNCDKYQQAKSKVIFEGFEVKERSCNDSVFKYVENGLIAVYYFNIRSKKFEPNTDFKIIEDLIPYNLTLTDNVKI